MRNKRLETCGVFDIHRTQLFDDREHPTFYQLTLSDESKAKAGVNIADQIATIVEPFTFGSIAEAKAFATTATRAGFPNLV